jgi:hypothetical protein
MLRVRMFWGIRHQPFVWRVKCGVSEALMVAVARLSPKYPTPQDQGSITALTLRRVPGNLAVQSVQSKSDKTVALLRS